MSADAPVDSSVALADSLVRFGGREDDAHAIEVMHEPDEWITVGHAATRLDARILACAIADTIARAITMDRLNRGKKPRA